jgi:hypothetical protein
MQVRMFLCFGFDMFWRRERRDGRRGKEMGDVGQGLRRVKEGWGRVVDREEEEMRQKKDEVEQTG